MRRFYFKLHAVEEVRKRKEEDALRALAAAQRALQQEKTRKENLFQALKDSYSRCNEIAKSTVGVVAFKTEEDFIVGTRQRIAMTEQTILRAEKALKKRMDQYMEAKSERKKIEKLREREYERYQKKESKKELKQMDELYVQRARFSKRVA